MKNIIFISLFFFVTHGETAPSKSPQSMNSLNLSPNDIPSQYSFVVAGHIYGNLGHSVYPSGSVVFNTDKINRLNSNFFISLGDNFRQLDDLNVKNFKNLFANKLNVPIINVLGNHDIGSHPESNKSTPNYPAYTNLFGNTFYSFQIANDLFITLDTELDDGIISGEQLRFFKENLESYPPNIKNIFIFSHRLIWNESGENQFSQVLLPMLENLKAKIYWLSGDFYSRFFWRKLNAEHIIFIGTSIADTRDDVVLKISSNNSKVEIEPIKLVEGQSKDFKSYQRTSPRASKIFRGMIWKISNLFLDRHFSMGILSAFFFLGLFMTSKKLFFFLKK